MTRLLVRPSKESLPVGTHGAERMYGYSAKEAIGKPVSMLVPSNRPDEIPEILGTIETG